MTTASNAPERTLAKAFVTGGAGFIGGHLLRVLQRDGVQAIALARSAESAKAVEALGARAHRTDLHDVNALAAGMTGCDTVFHAGSYLPDWNMDKALRENVQGSRNIIEAARRAGVRRVVYVSGTGVTIGSGPVIDWDESHPRGKPVGVLCASRVRSEAAVVAENGKGGIETVVVRFPYVWGPGETLTPQLKGAIQTGRFRWFDGGHHLISTAHVDNCIQGLVLAAKRGTPGGIYWITDGPPVEFRSFVEAHLRQNGLTPPTREMPYRTARRLADTMFFLWRLLGRKNPPPLTPTIVRFLGQQITVNDARARRELGYAPTKSWPTPDIAPFVEPPVKVAA